MTLHHEFFNRFVDRTFSIQKLYHCALFTGRSVHPFVTFPYKRRLLFGGATEHRRAWDGVMQHDSSSMQLSSRPQTQCRGSSSWHAGNPPTAINWLKTDACFNAPRAGGQHPLIPHPSPLILSPPHPLTASPSDHLTTSPSAPSTLSFHNAIRSPPLSAP